MTQINKTPKKFGLNLACNMAADCIRENYAPPSVVLSNLVSLQKSDTFPSGLQKEFFKRPTPIPNSELQNIRTLMEALRSPNNGVANLLSEKMSAGWVFKKAPPGDNQQVAKSPAKKVHQNRVQKTTYATSPKIVVKKSTNT